MKWRPKFSMRTLLLLAIVAGCGLMLWRNWAPWQLEREILMGDQGMWRHRARIFSADKRSILWLAGTQSNQIKDLSVWSLVDHSKIFSLKFDDQVSKCALSPDGGMVALIRHRKVSGEISVERWNTRTQRLEHEARLPITKRHYVVFLADGESVFTGDSIFSGRLSGFKELKLNTYVRRAFMLEDIAAEDARSQILIPIAMQATTLEEYAERASGLEVKARASPCGRWILTDLGDTGTQIWNWKTGERVGHINSQALAFVNTIAFFPTDDRVLIQSSTDGVFESSGYIVLKLSTGKIIDQGNPLVFLANGERFSRTADKVVMGSSGKASFRIWEQERGERTISNWMGGHHVGISPNGKFLLAVVDKVLMVADADSGAKLASLKHPKPQHEPFYSADGEVIYSSTPDSILVWRRHRPEYEWGIWMLVEFWAFMFFAGVLGWSIRQDRNIFRAAIHA